MGLFCPSDWLLLARSKYGYFMQVFLGFVYMDPNVQDVQGVLSDDLHLWS